MHLVHPLHTHTHSIHRIILIEWVKRGFHRLHAWRFFFFVFRCCCCVFSSFLAIYMDKVGYRIVYVLLLYTHLPTWYTVAGWPDHIDIIWSVNTSSAYGVCASFYYLLSFSFYLSLRPATRYGTHQDIIVHKSYTGCVPYMGIAGVCV